MEYSLTVSTERIYQQWLSIAVAVVGFYFSKDVILLSYGESYSNASEVLAIHVFAGIFMSLGLVTGRYLTAEK